VFCDAMTHEIGHLFGHLDSGQTNPSSITYPFLSSTSPNLNSVAECKNVALRYGSQEFRNEEILPAPTAAMTRVSPAAGSQSKQPRDAYLRRAV
jgi:hypothetical protein